MFFSFFLCAGQNQMQHQRLSEQQIYTQYVDLFAPDWKKPFYLGDTPEAIRSAKARETEFIGRDRKIDSISENTALYYEEYRDTQKIFNYRAEERFHPNHNRKFGTEASEEVIRIAENNIRKLEELQDARNAYIEVLKHKRDFGEPVILQYKEKLTDTLAKIKNGIEILSARFSKQPPAQAFSQIFNLFKKIRNTVEREGTVEEVERLKIEIQELCQRIINNPKSKHIQPASNIFSLSEELYNHYKNVKTIDPQATLTESEQKKLSEYQESQNAFEKDTREKIALEKKRIQFLKDYPDFFGIEAKERWITIGLSEPNEAKKLKYGNNRTLGIIDMFPQRIQDTAILHQATNPEFVGHSPESSHGVHVAGIAVGGISNNPNATRMNWDDEPIGVAPSAQYKMFDISSLSAHRRCGIADADDTTEEIWDVDKMVDLIERYALDIQARESGKRIPWELSQNYYFAHEHFVNNPLFDSANYAHNPQSTLSNEQIKTNILLSYSLKNFFYSLYMKFLMSWPCNIFTRSVKNNSQANHAQAPSDSSVQLFNVSLGFGSLDRFKKIACSRFKPEAPDHLFVFLNEILKGRLFVIALGNDGIYLDTTMQHRVVKALAQSPHTQSGFMGVINLMQDGLTLHPTANVPGKDKWLQKRTLSAVGTDVNSVVLYNPDNQEHQDAKEVGLPILEKMTGSSMAAPQVSGSATALASLFTKIKRAQVADCLLKGATPLILSELVGYWTRLTAVELPITTGELEQMLRQSPDGLKIGDLTITQEVWDVSQEHFGQGRVNLNGAIEWARKLLNQEPEWDAT